MTRKWVPSASSGETFRKHLQGHIAPQLRVRGAIDLAHAALTDQLADLVLA
jgi:hypothetical protein